MELLGKIKIHELAKEIGMSSKDVLEKAKSLGIDVTSHLSNVTDEQATEIRNAYSKNNKNNVKKEWSNIWRMFVTMLNGEET